jgi:hypothetical protein
MEKDFVIYTDYLVFSGYLNIITRLERQDTWARLWGGENIFEDYLLVR